MAPKVYVVIYSVYHHNYDHAKLVIEGLQKAGCETKLFQVPEILSDDILAKMKAPPKLDLPIITPEDLEEADAFVFGFPTRFGILPAQVKAFFDSTGGLWAKGALRGKMVTCCITSGTQHGGPETTALCTIPFFTSHGMIYVPLGFSNAPEVGDADEILGATPFGSGVTVALDGSRKPSEKEIKIAVAHGESFGKTVVAYTLGLKEAEKLEA